jgi:methyl-accepting chemotaxis protein
MSHSLPRAIDSTLGDIRAATDELLSAVADGSPEIVRASLEKRAAAIDRLRTIFRQGRADLSPTQLEVMGDVARSIASQADEARAALHASMERARKELETFDRLAGAVRSYSSRSRDTVLDRSR